MLEFDGQVRRRARLLGRVAAAAATPQMYPSAPVARAFWFDGIANFGDALTPWLLRRAGVIPLPSTASTADLAGVGSILEMLPTDFHGAVWGTGSLYGEPIHLPRAAVVAVRGALTRQVVSAPGNVALGDPGILASLFLRRPRQRHRLGIVPHHMHEHDPLWSAVASTDGVTVIDVRRGPSAVLRDIAECRAILTTSLHGLVVADSFGIPAVWTGREPDLWGGRFKFDDYETALAVRASRRAEVDTVDDIERAVAHARPVDAAVVNSRQHALLAALEKVDLPRASPLLALAHKRDAASRGT